MCWIAPTSVHPTQFALGLRDVNDKKITIASIKNNRDALHTYLAQKKVPAVKGPKAKFYIVDGHHTTRALAEAEVSKVYITIIKDYSVMSFTEFFQTLQNENLLWMYDENGQRQTEYDRIPEQITKLKDDPYRSLAENAAEAGAYTKNGVFFQQFKWANYFRPRINRQLVETNYSEAVRRAKEIAKEQSASDLPGYDAKE
jgi:hypothetical protein